jgi:hypothetical protein
MINLPVEQHSRWVVMSVFNPHTDFVRSSKKFFSVFFQDA